jgi:TolB-like protein
MAGRGFRIVLALGLVAQPLAAQDTRPGVAVLPFESGGSPGRDPAEVESLRRGIAGLLVSELKQRADLRLVEREETQRMLEEQALGSIGRVDAATAARVGQMIGARYMITGTFIDLYGEFRLDARVIDVETSVILHSVTNDPKYRQGTDLIPMIRSLAERIVAQANFPALPTVLARTREVPLEAVQLYSRAVMAEDRGDLARAIELYEQAVRLAPEFTEAREGLRKARERRPGG